MDQSSCPQLPSAVTATDQGEEEKNMYQSINVQEMWAQLEARYRRKVDIHEEYEKAFGRVKTINAEAAAVVADESDESGVRLGCSCTTGCRKIGRCSCLLAGRACSELCNCYMCENAEGDDILRRPAPFARKMIYCQCKRGCTKMYCMCRKHGVECGPRCHPGIEEEGVVCSNKEPRLVSSKFFLACYMSVVV